MGDVSGWIEGHWLVDYAVQGALVSVLALIILGSVSGSIYWALWARRLCRRANINKFVVTPIPGLHRGKLAGQELEFAAAIRDTVDAEAGTAAAVDALNSRTLALEEALMRMEDVSGRLP